MTCRRATRRADIALALALSPDPPASILAKPVLFAIAADAARYNYWIPGNRDYVYDVFNPYDGVGTPFFGGYITGPAGDDRNGTS